MASIPASDERVVRFKERVEAEWAGDETAAAWQKHYPAMRKQMAPVTEALIAAADLKPGLHVLDLASGTGDPALSIAPRVLPGGRVMASDFSPGMIAALRANAAGEGIDNIDTHVCDVHELDAFETASFDRVTSRFGVMFCGDIDHALSGVRRVLKPAGKAALLVWGGPIPGSYFGSTVKPFIQRMPEPPDPDGPSPMRFAEPGKLRNLVESAGFTDVREAFYNLPTPYVGSPEQLLSDLFEIAAPFRNACAKLSRLDREDGEAEALSNLRGLERDGLVHVTSPVIVVTGMAP